MANVRDQNISVSTLEAIKEAGFQADLPDLLDKAFNLHEAIESGISMGATTVTVDQDLVRNKFDAALIYVKNELGYNTSLNIFNDVVIALDDPIVVSSGIPEILHATLARNGTFNNGWLSIGENGVRTNQARYAINPRGSVTRSFYVKELALSQIGVGDAGFQPSFKIYSHPRGDTGNIGTGDTLVMNAVSTLPETVENLQNFRIWRWEAPDKSIVLDSDNFYAFRLERLAGGTQFNDIRIHLTLVEII